MLNYSRLPFASREGAWGGTSAPSGDPRYEGCGPAAVVSLVQGGSVSKIVGAQWYLHEVLQLQGHNRVLLMAPNSPRCSDEHSTSPNNTSPTFVGCGARRSSA
jgi:hypothetical protein